ncbi:MAG: hypothetical protein H0V60_03290 [Actinobacteria bacterium]|nr:hypothetical protein [Actinomycetota bacterium]
MSELVFDVLEAKAERHAVTPTVTLRIRISETAGEAIDSIALRCQIRIEPQRRRYTATEAEALKDLFGETKRWGETLKPLHWTIEALIVPGFRGSTEIEVPIACTYDLEVAWASYLNALQEGSIPILTLYSGTVFVKTQTGFNVSQVPWHKEAQYELPVRVLREAMNRHFPDSGWLRLPRDTMHQLQVFKGRRGLATWESVIHALLSEAEDKGA